MHGLNYLDWSVIGLYFVVIFAVAIYYAKKAGKDTSSFFLSGRNMPWWLAGTAMVATTFAADTPLAITEFVANNGIAGNWFWWNMAFGSMLTVFFFAKLWRRAGILTDVEFVELRYSGKEAAVLRGFRALYLGLFMNSIVLGWVNKAMEKIFQVTIPGVDSFTLVVACMVIIAVYASASGLLGSARIDALQFAIAMGGCILLAIIAVDIPEVGGIDGMKSKLGDWVFQFTPKIGGGEISPIAGGAFALSAGAFIAYIGLQWWSSWYPGSDPGGGGYIAQRMMSAKDEKNSLFATLWFTIAHYCLRPWPWIIVALAALTIMPRLDNSIAGNSKAMEQYEQAYKLYTAHISANKDYAELAKDRNLIIKAKQFEDKDFYEKYENTVDPGKMYPKLMVRHLPAGLLGLMIAVFLAAYMSTISSQLNWGTSYIINDFYKRFVRKDAPETHYVLISRIAIVFLTIFSLLITKYLLTTVSGAWTFIVNASAGMGAVLILRWYWHRINAWSEISAMIAPLIIYPISVYVFDMKSPMTLYPTVLGTTIVWLVVTFVTKPTEEKKMETFFRKIHPGGIGWKTYAAKYPDVKQDTGYKYLFMQWLFGVLMIYSTLYGVGQVIFKEYLSGFIGLAIAAVSAWIVYKGFSKTQSLTESE
jgi:Na+/proline symporter